MQLQTRESLKQSLAYCLKNKKKLFVKFKDDEKYNDIKELLEHPQITVLENDIDLVEAIKLVLPGLVICHSSSTTVAELILSGFKVVTYDAVYEGFSEEYLDFYKNLKLFDLSNLETKVDLVAIDPKTLEALKTKLDLNSIDNKVLNKVLINLE